MTIVEKSIFVVIEYEGVAYGAKLCRICTNECIDGFVGLAEAENLYQMENLNWIPARDMTDKKFKAILASLCVQFEKLETMKTYAK